MLSGGEGPFAGGASEDAPRFDGPKRNWDGSPVTYRMRVWFSKQGRAAMLSHLEVVRTLERVVRRAGLPYAISNGFSPHMRISFGAALPVGVGGLHECFDVLLTERVDEDGATEAMKRACPPALDILDCEYVGRRDQAPSAAYPYSSYVVVLDCDASDAFAGGIPIPETVRVIRKKKEKVLVVSEFLVDGCQASGNQLSFVMKSGENGSLRPDVFMDAILESTTGIRVQSITRVRQAARFDQLG